MKIELQSPVPETERPLQLEKDLVDQDELHSLVQALNERLHRIDRICCAPQEYVLTACRPTSADWSQARQQ